MWFDILLNSVFFCMNRMWNVVPLQSVGEDFVVNFPGSQFQAQQQSINLLIKSCLLGHSRTRNLLKARHVSTEMKPDEIRAGLEHTPQKSLRRLAQETGISKSSAVKATKRWISIYLNGTEIACTGTSVSAPLLRQVYFIVFVEWYLTCIGKIL
jgi:hypothetical protein